MRRTGASGDLAKHDNMPVALYLIAKHSPDPEGLFGVEAINEIKRRQVR